MSAQPTADTRRAIAARLNGAKSKGPITEEGKAKSSRNAIKHGLCSERDLVIPIDPQDEFESFQANLHEELAPTDQIQTVLVERIVACAWRLRRLVQIESGLLSDMSKEDRGLKQSFFYNNYDAKLMTLSRYEANLNRTLHRSLKALKSLQERTQEPDQPSRSQPQIAATRQVTSPAFKQFEQEALRRIMDAWPQSQVKATTPTAEKIPNEPNHIRDPRIDRMSFHTEAVQPPSHRRL